MSDLYFEEDYAESDYVEGVVMAIDALPPVPQRGDSKDVFDGKADTFMAALVLFAQQADAVAIAMNNNATNAESTTSLTIGTGDRIFVADVGRSYVVGQTVKAASTASPTNWMQGDVTAYNTVTGSLTINMNLLQGSGTFAAWTLSLSNASSSGGSITQDFAVKSLQHAIGANIASAATIDLSTATGNIAHLTGNTTVTGATMTAGKDVLLIIDGTPQFNYHATNLKLNSGGANITGAAGDVALFTYDGTTVRVTYIKMSGHANVETAAPAGAPVGSFLLYAGSSPPAGYLTCPTTLTNISRTTYATLFTAIGTTWGVGDSSTTFGLPWFASGYAILQANPSVTLEGVGKATAGDNLAHTHTYADVDNTGSVSTGGSWINSVGNLTTKTSSSSGGSANLAAGARVLICIKYQ
ncbi:tail collar domain [Nitrosospira sp. Nsp2]|uniref:phage tail protein n=1 Tax=Nitrosospira sp. Nsp2 TaxID=136548 RepID=UPI000D313F3B|nr:phage tail protein [Nitrosospira sp. Nsp2]PTR17508.1 tail collar domain [Nitrosospira sp. Nsp2]